MSGKAWERLRQELVKEEREAREPRGLPVDISDIEARLDEIHKTVAAIHKTEAESRIHGDYPGKLYNEAIKQEWRPGEDPHSFKQLPIGKHPSCLELFVKGASVTAPAYLGIDMAKGPDKTVVTTFKPSPAQVAVSEIIAAERAREFAEDLDFSKLPEDVQKKLMEVVMRGWLGLPSDEED